MANNCAPVGMHVDISDCNVLCAELRLLLFCWCSLVLCIVIGNVHLDSWAFRQGLARRFWMDYSFVSLVHLNSYPIQNSAGVEITNLFVSPGKSDFWNASLQVTWIASTDSIHLHETFAPRRGVKRRFIQNHKQAVRTFSSSLLADPPFFPVFLHLLWSSFCVQQNSIFTHTNNHKAKYPPEYVVDRKYVVPEDYKENRRGLDRYLYVHHQFHAAKMDRYLDSFWCGCANDFFWQLVTAIGKS